MLTRRLSRLAFDVHDGPMQNLAVLGFSLSALRRTVEKIVPLEHRPMLDSDLEQITEEIGKVEGELRGLIGALEDDAIDRFPMRAAECASTLHI